MTPQETWHPDIESPRKNTHNFAINQMNMEVKKVPLPYTHTHTYLVWLTVTLGKLHRVYDANILPLSVASCG